MRTIPTPLQEFATATVSPWSFAWLVDDDDWDHLETLIHYNCILLGGIHNVILPLAALGARTKFDLFLRMYDPDFVVLPPGVNDIPTTVYGLANTPFAIVRWNQIHQIMTSDPRSGSNTWAAHIRPFGQDKPYERDLIATADPLYPDTSRLALLACGDVLPAEHDWDVFDGQVYLDAHGYRETRLERVARSEARLNVGARLGDNDQVIAAPSRVELAAIVKDEHKFPLEGTKAIFEACCSLQRGSSTGYNSFITRTTNQLGGTADRRFARYFETPAMTIMISDHFGFQESLLFWNLRSNHVIVTWASFDQLENERDAVCEWLDSDVGGTFYAFGGDIAFASSKQDGVQTR